MQAEIDSENEIIILRSDEVVPSLQLIYEQYIEKAVKRDDVNVISILTGQIGIARFQFSLLLDDVHHLHKIIDALCEGTNSVAQWQSWDKHLSIECHVEYDHLGPPVFCKVQLSTSMPGPGMKSSVETYEYGMYTNLTWLGIFSSGLQRLLTQYREG